MHCSLIGNINYYDTVTEYGGTHYPLPDNTVTTNNAYITPDSSSILWKRVKPNINQSIYCRVDNIIM